MWYLTNHPAPRGRVSVERSRVSFRLAVSLEHLRFLPQDLNGQLDRFQVSVQAQDGCTKGESTIDIGRGEEDAAVSLYCVDQSPVEGVRISSTGEVTERHYGEIRGRSYLEALFESHPPVEVAREEKLFL